MAETYHLRVEEFDSVVSTFMETIDDTSLTRNPKEGVNTREILYQLKVKDCKKNTNLHCYIKAKGVSFRLDGCNKHRYLAEEICKKLIDETKLEIGDQKYFSAKDISEEIYETILSFLEEVGCKCENDTVDDNIKYRKKITGKHGDVITVTYYNNGTLLAQGRPGPTFIDFYDIASELISPSEVKKNHLILYDITTPDVINASLKEHLPNAYSVIADTKLDAIISPSLVLLNTRIELKDCTAYILPALKGAESIIKELFSNENVTIPRTGFKEFFIENNWVKGKEKLFPENKRQKILNLYNFYHKYRHPNIHADVTPELTNTLDYNNALEIVTDCLKLIDQVYLN